MRRRPQGEGEAKLVQEAPQGEGAPSIVLWLVQDPPASASGRRSGGGAMREMEAEWKTCQPPVTQGSLKPCFLVGSLVGVLVYAPRPPNGGGNPERARAGGGGGDPRLRSGRSGSGRPPTGPSSRPGVPAVCPPWFSGELRENVFGDGESATAAAK